MHKEFKNKLMETTSPTMVWHYAPWTYLPAIIESGFLKGSNAGAADESPMLWFSANQKWEPTATKMIRNGAGAISTMTFEQQVKLLGCIRFGLDANDYRLLNWKDACNFAGTPRESRRSLERVGKKSGADPAHWFAVASEISLSELHFQVWEGGWRDAESHQNTVTLAERQRQ